MLGFRLAILNKPRLLVFTRSFLSSSPDTTASYNQKYVCVLHAGYTSAFNFCWVSVRISTGVVSPVRGLS